MKSCLPDYKKYPFPVKLLSAYVILSIVGIALIETLAIDLLSDGPITGFFNTIFNVALAFVVVLIVWGVCALLLCAFRGKKHYRSIGLYRFSIIVTIICPFVFFGIIAFLKLTDVAYTFFNFFILLSECSFPMLMSCSLRWHTDYCIRCRLMNTLYVNSSKTETIGTEHKFHNEGGYYYNDYSSVNFSDGNSANVKTTYYVPKTAVYDGLYEKKKTDRQYHCCVCQNEFTRSTLTEEKIG